MKIKIIDSKNNFWDIKEIADKNNLIVGGNYPVGGELEIKVDKEMKKYLNDIGYKKVKENDIIIIDNGWTLD